MVRTELPKTPMPPATKGFEFRQRTDKLNWRLLASMNIGNIIKHVLFIEIVFKTIE